MKTPTIFEKYRQDVDNKIKLIIHNRNSELYRMMDYHFGWSDANGNSVQSNSGKAMRPALCLFSCEALNGDVNGASWAAAALELTHNFSLILDDVQDDDMERRHRPTVWALWGKPQAINAGTAMHILSSYALSQMKACGVSFQKQLLVYQKLDEITLKLIEGQYLDISFEDKFDITVKDYINMIELKTAALISGSMEIGAGFASEDETVVNNFKEMGKCLGLAFQVKDDILGIWGNQNETGKPLGNDIRRRKKSFPIVYALENAPEYQRHELVTIYSNKRMTEDNVYRVLEILNTVNAQENAQKFVQAYCDNAKNNFSNLKLELNAKNELSDVIEFMSGRNY